MSSPTSPVAGVDPGSVSPGFGAFIGFTFVLALCTCGWIVFRSKNLLAPIAREIHGYPDVLSRRPDFGALARASPFYLFIAVMGLLNFGLSFGATYGEWGVAQSSDWLSITCINGQSNLSPTQSQSATPTPRRNFPTMTSRPQLPSLTPRPSRRPGPGRLADQPPVPMVPAQSWMPSPSPIVGQWAQSDSLGATNCWLYIETMHVISSCTRQQSVTGSYSYMTYTTLDTIGSTGYSSYPLADAKFRDKAAVSWAFAFLQLAEWLSFISFLQAFVTHQQIRRKLTAMHRGPLVRTECCAAADGCCRSSSQNGCADRCEPINGTKRSCCRCWSPTAFGNARFLLCIQSVIFCLYWIAFVLGGTQVVRTGLIKAGLTQGAGFGICAWLVAITFIFVCLAGVAYVRLLAADKVMKEGSVIDPLTSAPIAGSGARYSGLDDTLWGGRLSVGSMPSLASSLPPMGDVYAMHAMHALSGQGRGDGCQAVYNPYAHMGLPGIPVAAVAEPYAGDRMRGLGPAPLQERAGWPGFGHAQGWAMPPGIQGQADMQVRPQLQSSGATASARRQPPPAEDEDPFVPRKLSLYPPSSADAGRGSAQDQGQGAMAGMVMGSAPYYGSARHVNDAAPGIAGAQSAPMRASMAVPAGYTIVTVTGPDGRPMPALVPITWTGQGASL